MIFAAANSGDVFPPIVYLLTIILLAGGLLFLNDRFIRRSRRRKLDAKVNAFEERLKKPNFEALEKHFGCAFPAGIKALYGDEAEFTREEFEVAGRDASGKDQAWHIAFYEPADLDHVREAWPDTKEVFEFANDGCGNGYTVDPRQDDPPVRFYDHETGEWETVAAKFSEFIAMERRA